MAVERVALVGLDQAPPRGARRTARPLVQHQLALPGVKDQQEPLRVHSDSLLDRLSCGDVPGWRHVTMEA